MTLLISIILMTFNILIFNIIYTTKKHINFSLFLILQIFNLLNLRRFLVFLFQNNHIRFRNDNSLIVHYLPAEVPSALGGRSPSPYSHNV